MLGALEKITLKEAFRNLGYEVSTLGEKLVVKTGDDIGPDVVLVHLEDDLVGFSAFYLFKEDVPEERRLRFVNDLNSKAKVPRFSVFDLANNALHVDYFLLLPEDASPQLILRAFRRFCKDTALYFLFSEEAKEILQ